MQHQLDFMPTEHRQFLQDSVRELRSDNRIVGVAGGGSFIRQQMDEFSDLDLVVAIEPQEFEQVMAERTLIASRLGKLVSSFTGEHVGEPRLLICLYDEPTLHVDLKFVSLTDAADRVETPVILWERESRLSEAFMASKACYPQPNLQWIEDRFWIWIHNAAMKIGRGELFEAIDFIGYLRSTVLGPLLHLEAGSQPCGLRKIERVATERPTQLQATLPDYSQQSCLQAVEAVIRLYLSLRNSLAFEGLRTNPAAERVVKSYLETIAEKINESAPAEALEPSA
ncbi:hypothetical protein [Dongshaea marina]|uniref:hypothetical protein n=1 Tax=Dongshaea marina TaxID=2047966 RepID=UPI001900FB65|nr:hypothetical protein [Dongshaea marina]